MFRKHLTFYIITWFDTPSFAIAPSGTHHEREKVLLICPA